MSLTPAEKRQKKHEKRVRKEAKKRMKEERQAKSAVISSKRRFARTFVIALALFLVVLTPAGIALNDFLDVNPFVDEGEEEITFEVMVDPESLFYEEFSDSQRINILMLGVNPPMTDTIMLASFDPEIKHLDIVSIPRDTYYPREGYTGQGEYKINAAYKNDPMNSAKAVSDVLLGVPINYYVVVEYDDVKTIVDEVGGVPMNITQKGGMHYSDPYDKPPLVIDIPEGEQILDGEHSVQFLRYRKGYVTGDLGRVEAQQTWLKNAIKAGIDHGIMKTAEVAFDCLDSNFTYKAMISLGTKAIGISAEDIRTYTIPNTPQDEAPWYVFPETAGIEDMMREIYSIKPEETEGTGDGAEGEASADE